MANVRCDFLYRLQHCCGISESSGMVELEVGQTQIGTWQAIIDPSNPELNFHLEGTDDMINNLQEASFYSSSCIYYL